MSTLKEESSDESTIISSQTSTLTRNQGKGLTGIFLGLIWGRISAPSELKNEHKLPKIFYIIPNFLVLYFDENFIEIQTKIPKLQMHENLYENVNEHGFSFTFLCKFSGVFRMGN